MIFRLFHEMGFTSFPSKLKESAVCVCACAKNKTF